MKVIAFFVALFILAFILEKILIKLFGIKKKKIADTPGKKVDFWGRIIIVIIFVSSILFVYLHHSDYVFKWSIMIYFTILYGFQAITEYIYMKETKQHITSIFFLIMMLVFFYNIDELVIFLSK